MRTLPTTIHIIGPGKLGEALIAGFLNSGRLRVEQLSASSGRSSARPTELRALYPKLRLTHDNLRYARQARTIILAVKPQVLPTVCRELAGQLRPGQLVVSFVAMRELCELQGLLGHRTVVRAMTNLAVRLGLGCSGLYANAAVAPRYVRRAHRLLGAVGSVFERASDEAVERFTIESGTGLAVAAAMLIGFKRAGIHLGENRRVAQQIALQVMHGAHGLLQNGTYPSLEELIYAVMTPAGTTTRTILRLEQGSLSALIVESMVAGMERISEFKHQPARS